MKERGFCSKVPRYELTPAVKIEACLMTHGLIIILLSLEAGSDWREQCILSCSGEAQELILYYRNIRNIRNTASLERGCLVHNDHKPLLWPFKPEREEWRVLTMNSCRSCQTLHTLPEHGVVLLSDHKC